MSKTIHRYQHPNDKLRMWATKDYLIIRYEDLERDHLFNIVGMLERASREYKYPNLMREARLRFYR
jgi:hypothetical protein